MHQPTHGVRAQPLRVAHVRACRDRVMDTILRVVDLIGQLHGDVMV